MPLTGDSVREGAVFFPSGGHACPSLDSQKKKEPWFSTVAFALPLECIFLFGAETTVPASFGLTVARSNEVVDGKPDLDELGSVF